MKLLNIYLTIVLLTVAFSCNTAHDKREADSMIEANFEESVVLLQRINPAKIVKDNQTIEVILSIEIVSFDENVPFQNEYIIDNIKYTDDGQFNDLLGGDGIYTSVQTFILPASLFDQKFNQEIVILHKGLEFKYDGELENYLIEKFSEKTSIKFGCKVRLVTCPETNWLNTCWPAPSPCWCVEFYDCSFEIELGS